MRWIEPGGSFDAGDRTLHLFKPPIFDGPTTRGLYDTKTAAMWIVDTFACLTPGAIHHVQDLPRDLVDANLPAFNSLVSPWHHVARPAAYRQHVDEVEALGVLAVASAHGPIMTGDAHPRGVRRRPRPRRQADHPRARSRAARRARREDPRRRGLVEQVAQNVGGSRSSRSRRLDAVRS